MLVLPIKKRWFEMIVNGEKKEEYRELKPYYDSRFKRYMPRPTNFRNEYIAAEFFIVFRNGYSYNSPSVKCRCIVDIGTGKKEWGAIPKKRYYILKILEIIEIKNWDNPNPSKVKEAMAVAALPAIAPITPIEDMQKEITKAINKQFAIGIDIGEEISRSGQSRKNTMMFGG